MIDKIEWMKLVRKTNINIMKFETEKKFTKFSRKKGEKICKKFEKYYMAGLNHMDISWFFFFTSTKKRKEYIIRMLTQKYTPLGVKFYFSPIDTLVWEVMNIE